VWAGGLSVFCVYDEEVCLVIFVFVVGFGFWVSVASGTDGQVYSFGGTNRVWFGDNLWPTQGSAMTMRIGMMTGGGDAPGLNGIIESVSRTLLGNGHSVIGILDGFEGVFEGRTREIRWNEINGIHAQAGTFLGTSNKSKIDGREVEFQTQFEKLKLDCLIAAGGDGTFIGLKKIAPNIPIVGVPKTIDNDLQGTEVTFGYDTAISVVADAVDALRSTADAHHRVIVVETMGRTAG
jgi:6-phosphofructokinase 1